MSDDPIAESQIDAVRPDPKTCKHVWDRHDYAPDEQFCQKCGITRTPPQKGGEFRKVGDTCKHDSMSDTCEICELERRCAKLERTLEALETWAEERRAALEERAAEHPGLDALVYLENAREFVSLKLRISKALSAHGAKESGREAK